MAEITPPPSKGSILKLDTYTGSWTPQPAKGSILKLDLFTGWRTTGWVVGRVQW